MEKDILNLFLYSHKLRFNQIEKSLKERSNKISYHVNNMVRKKLIVKENDFYRLSENSEMKIPYLTSKNSVLAVILVAISKGKRVFLIKRSKRPFDDKLCLPGGRLVVGESIKEATERIMKEKFSIRCNFEKINSINLEHVKNNSGKVLHSFLLIFVNAKTKQKLNYTDASGIKSQVVSSDYYLIKNSLNERQNVGNLITQ